MVEAPTAMQNGGPTGSPIAASSAPGPRLERTASGDYRTVPVD